MDEDDQPLDPDPVFEWRRQQLMDAGLDIWDAGRIALLPWHRADLHDVLRAIDAGCSFDLVVSIWL